MVNACKTLKDYVEYASRVRAYAEEMPIEDAVERAIKECIEEGILAEFLKKCRAEAKKMSIYEYDEERQRRWDREEGREEGEALGEARFAKLTKVLIEAGKTEELLCATEDMKYRKELYEEYGL